jgi:hypothetical protein
MPKPKAYSPEPGQKFQILYRDPSYDREWEHYDYAADRQEKNDIIRESRIAFKDVGEFKVILLPSKYWPPWKSQRHEEAVA